MSDMTADQLADDLEKQAKRQTRKGGTIEKLTKDYVVRTAAYTAINIPPQEEQITLLETDIRWDISMRYISIKQYGASLLKTAQTKTERTFAAALVRGRYDEKLREKAEASTGFRYLRPASLSSAEIDKVEDGENITRQLIGIVREGDIEREVKARLTRHGIIAAQWAEAAKSLNPRVFSNVKGADKLPSFKRRNKSKIKKKGDGKPSSRMEISDDSCTASVYAEHRLFDKLRVNGIIKRAEAVSRKILDQELELTPILP